MRRSTFFRVTRNLTAIVLLLKSTSIVLALEGAAHSAPNFANEEPGKTPATSSSGTNLSHSKVVSFGLDSKIFTGVTCVDPTGEDLTPKKINNLGAPILSIDKGKLATTTIDGKPCSPDHLDPALRCTVETAIEDQRNKFLNGNISASSMRDVQVRLNSIVITPNKNFVLVQDGKLAYPESLNTNRAYCVIGVASKADSLRVLDKEIILKVSENGNAIAYEPKAEKSSMLQSIIEKAQDLAKRQVEARENLNRERVNIQVYTKMINTKNFDTGVYKDAVAMREDIENAQWLLTQAREDLKKYQSEEARYKNDFETLLKSVTDRDEKEAVQKAHTEAMAGRASYKLYTHLERRAIEEERRPTNTLFPTQPSNSYISGHSSGSSGSALSVYSSDPATLERNAAMAVTGGSQPASIYSSDPNETARNVVRAINEGN